MLVLKPCRVRIVPNRILVIPFGLPIRGCGARFGHGAFAVWSCGVLKFSWGVLVLVMGCSAAAREGQRPRCPIRRHTGNEDVAPPVRLNPARKLLAGCIVFCDSDSCAKLLGDGVAKFCAKLSKQISRNHCPTRHTRHTRPTLLSASREAQSLALHCSLQVAKLKAQRPQGVVRRKVFRIGSTAFANFA